MRRTLAAAVITLALSAGSAVLGPPAAADVYPEWGSTSAPNAVLKKGCRDYRYSYAITPPEGTWGLEIFIIGPGGKHVYNGAFNYPYDPEQSTEKFQLCKATTKYGRFTIKARLSVQDGQEYVEGWLPPSNFRLHRRRN